MNHIFDANDAVTAQCRFNKVVRGDGCPLAVNFDKSTLVNQFTNGFQVWCTPSDVGFCKIRIVVMNVAFKMSYY